MMTTIFERETEVGKCSYESESSSRSQSSDSGFSTIYAHSIATVNGQRGVLKIEQHCYLRQGEDIPDQPWIRPELSFEPMLTSPAEMLQLAERQHEKFCQRVREEFPNQYMVA